MQTRRVGDTRPCIRHNMIEQLIKRWIAEDKRTRVAKLVDRTGFTERRRLHRPPSLEAAARLLPSDARCRVQLCSASFGRRRLHSAEAAPKSCCTTPMIHPLPAVLFTIRVMYLLSPRRGEEARQPSIFLATLARHPIFYGDYEKFLGRATEQDPAEERCSKSDFTALSWRHRLNYEEALPFFLFFFFSKRQTKRTVLLTVPFDKADKLLRFTANLPAGFSRDYQTPCSAYQRMQNILIKNILKS